MLKITIYLVWNYFFFGYGAGLVLWEKRFLQQPHLSLSYNIFIFQKQQIVKIIKKQKRKKTLKTMVTTTEICSWHLWAWCQPPCQLIAMEHSCLINISAAVSVPPAITDMQSNKSSKRGQSNPGTK